MKVLVADDEPNLRKSLASFFGSEGVDCVLAADGKEAIAMLESEALDALVLDLRMPTPDGLEILRWMREQGPRVPSIMISAHGDIGDAVEAMRLGAADYLVKPFDPEELSIRLRRVVRERRLSDAALADRARIASVTEFVGGSPAVLEVLRLIDKAAKLPSTVLVTGESGTGKEVAARLLHERSGRQGSFVAVNLGALPESLMESELFGYEKGAFTGAVSRKPGLFELAHAGTLFLDEIGELPLQVQVKLLRAIQERKITRLGGVKPIPVDTRIVAATNRDLEKELREGRFREDLYYRINVLRVHLPPLRERPGDIAVLAGYFLKKIGAELGKELRDIRPEAMRLLETYPFPGNVRELQNVMERAVILADGDVIEASDFQFSTAATLKGAEAVPESGRPGARNATLAELEREAIVVALRRNGFRREKTAQELGIARRTLLNKIKDYDISVPETPESPSY